MNSWLSLKLQILTIAGTLLAWIYISTNHEFMYGNIFGTMKFDIYMDMQPL